MWRKGALSPKVRALLLHRHAHAVDGDEVADLLAGDLLSLRLGGLEMRDDLVDDDGLR